MYHILLVTALEKNLGVLADALKEISGIRVDRAATGADALESVAASAPDLVVGDEELADMTGLELVRRVIGVNAMVNTVLVSGLSDEDFHEASEGLGVLFRIPPEPGKKEAETIAEAVKRLPPMHPDPEA